MHLRRWYFELGQIENRVANQLTRTMKRELSASFGLVDELWERDESTKDLKLEHNQHPTIAVAQPHWAIRAYAYRPCRLEDVALSTKD